MKTKTQDADTWEILDGAIKAVCATFRITPEELTDTALSGKSRKRPLPYARTVFCALCILDYNKSTSPEFLIPLSQVGGAIGKDHSTAHDRAYTAHKNHMDSRNEEYIPLYYKARKLFMDFVALKGNVSARKRLSQIAREEARLRAEKEKILSQINNQL